MNNQDDTVKHIFGGYFLFDAIGGKKQKSQNKVSNSGTQWAINGHTPLVCWYPYRQNPTV